MKVDNQNNRLLSIDLARGLAVFFMIAVHTLEVFASGEVKNSLFGQIIVFFGGPPAAPVFMTLMGFSFMYSRKSEFKPRLLRGLKIFLLGYILNLIRGVVPFTLTPGLRPEILHSLPLYKINEYTLLTIVDILQFAGIALMIMAILQKFRINKHIFLFFAVVILMVSPFLWNLKPGVPVVDDILDLFLGNQPISFSFLRNKIAFPVFPWLSFPLLGMYLGETMKHSKNQNSTFKYFGLAGLITLGSGIIISAPDIGYHFNDYYHSRQGAMIFMCGFVVLWLYVNKLLIDKIPMNMLFALLFRWSTGVTNIYFVQWTIIIWSIAFFGLNLSSYVTVIILILTFTVISHFVNELLLYLRLKYK